MGAMSEQQDKAAGLEQRYVQEYGETEELLEGLDPERPDAGQTTEQVQGISSGGQTEDDVEKMAREDP